MAKDRIVRDCDWKIKYVGRIGFGENSVTSSKVGIGSCGVDDCLPFMVFRPSFGIVSIMATASQLLGIYSGMQSSLLAQDGLT